MNIHNYIRNFERFVIFILVLLMGIVILITTLELVFFIIKEIINSFSTSQLLIEKKEMLKIFSLFFNVLIGMELYETVRLYLKEDVFHAEFVLLVGLIAVSRKVIILDYSTLHPAELFAIATLIVVLAGGYYILKLTQRKKFNESEHKEKEK